MNSLDESSIEAIMNKDRLYLERVAAYVGIPCEDLVDMIISDKGLGSGCTIHYPSDFPAYIR